MFFGPFSACVRVIIQLLGDDRYMSAGCVAVRGVALGSRCGVKRCKLPRALTRTRVRWGVFAAWQTGGHGWDSDAGGKGQAM